MRFVVAKIPSNPVNSSKSSQITSKNVKQFVKQVPKQVRGLLRPVKLVTSNLQNYVLMCIHTMSWLSDSLNDLGQEAGNKVSYARTCSYYKHFKMVLTVFNTVIEYKLQNQKQVYMHVELKSKQNKTKNPSCGIVG